MMQVAIKVEELIIKLREEYLKHIREFDSLALSYEEKGCYTRIILNPKRRMYLVTRIDLLRFVMTEVVACRDETFVLSEKDLENLYKGERNE